METPTNRVAKVFAPFFFPLKATRLMISRWELGQLVLIPLGFGAALYGFILYFLFHAAPGWLEQFLPGRQNWWGAVIYYVAWVFFIVFVIAVAAFFYGSLGRLLMAPFTERISARTEPLIGAPVVAELTLKETLKDLPRLIRVELLKLAFSLTCLLCVFIATTLFPPLGIVGTMVSCWVLAFEYVDFPLERRQWPFRKRLGWALSQFGSLLSFGAMMMLMMAVPIVGIIGLPVGIIAGTMTFHYLQPKELQSDRS